MPAYSVWYTQYCLRICVDPRHSTPSANVTKCSNVLVWSWARESCGSRGKRSRRVHTVGLYCTVCVCVCVCVSVLYVTHTHSMLRISLIPTLRFTCYRWWRASLEECRYALRLATCCSTDVPIQVELQAAAARSDIRLQTTAYQAVAVAATRLPSSASPSRRGAWSRRAQPVGEKVGGKGLQP